MKSLLCFLFTSLWRWIMNHKTFPDLLFASLSLHLWWFVKRSGLKICFEYFLSHHLFAPLCLSLRSSSYLESCFQWLICFAFASARATDIKHLSWQFSLRFPHIFFQAYSLVSTRARLKLHQRHVEIFFFKSSFLFNRSMKNSLLCKSIKASHRMNEYSMMLEKRIKFVSISIRLNRISDDFSNRK